MILLKIYLMDFSRIKDAVDVELMQKTRIVGVGSGGAYCLYDGLVRSGLGHLTVLDFDTVDAVNLCRQGFEEKDLGLSKVIALKNHLKAINRDLDYNSVLGNFLHWNDEELDAVFKDADLFLFMTDSFKAQALGNKLALRYKKPAIWAGFYEASECAEIVFYIPGVTPACFRCVVAPRYEAQAKEEIHISSACNTMFHSQLLDSLVGMLTLAILHNNTPGYKYSEWFGDKWEQNLIQFKCSPDYESRLFDNMFILTEGRSVLFNAIWQPITRCGCPDCNSDLAESLTDEFVDDHSLEGLSHE